MFEKFKLYLRYFWFCWKARKLLEDISIFLSLPDDDGPKYNLEIRNLNRKIRNRSKNEKQRDGVTKSQYLRLLIYQSFNDQADEDFSEDLQLPFILLAAWAISRKNTNPDMAIEEIQGPEEKEE